MADIYFKAAYGSIPLLVTEVESDGGRDLAVHSPSTGDVHLVQDRGRALRRARVEILFVEQPGQDPPLDRFRAFLELANAETAELFSHPIDGSYLAKVQDFRYTVSADERAVSVGCTFVAVDEPTAVAASGAGVSPLAGPEEVGASVSTLGTNLAAAGLSSDVPQSCLDRVTAWATADDPDARSVYLEVASLSSQIGDEVDRLDLLTDLARWPLYQQFVVLQYQVQRAAESVSSDTQRVFDLTIAAAIPLRVLCARLYGASDVDTRMGQVSKLNNLRSPGLLPAGALLKMPARDA